MVIKGGLGSKAREEMECGDVVGRLEEKCVSDFSTAVISQKIIRDGFKSWKIHLMELVDEFRRSLDYRLILLPPVVDLDIRLRALMSGIVESLCQEIGAESPSWSQRELFLIDPWFVAGIESLKASALLESIKKVVKRSVSLCKPRVENELHPGYLYSA